MIINKSNEYLQMLETIIRNKDTSKSDLIHTLKDFGYYMGTEIIKDRMLCQSTVITPMNKVFDGCTMDSSNSIVISTKDDYNFFASGLSKALKSHYQGYMNFNGVRGEATYTEKIRDISLPDINDGIPINTVYIAKSVISTGCTAITLAKKQWKNIVHTT